MIADQSLTPLRRLVAAEMLEERLEDDRIAAEQAYEAIIKDQTDKQAVLDAAAKLDLPKRVKARVIAKAAEWKYVPAQASDAERLAAETKQRRLAEAMNAVLEHEGLDLAKPTDDQVRRIQEALATFEELLGSRSLEACRARSQAIWHQEGVSQEAGYRARAELGLRDGNLFSTFSNLWLIASSADNGNNLTHPSDYAMQAIARWRVVDPKNDDRSKRGNQWDVNPDGFTGGRVLTAEEHRQLALEALAKARTLMQPGADCTPSPWANDEDAKALIAEAAALIEK